MCYLMRYRNLTFNPSRKFYRMRSMAYDITVDIEKYYKALNVCKQDSLTHLSIPLGLCIVGKMPDLDLYLPESKNAEFRRFRKKGLYMSQIEIDNLAENGVQNIFIESSDAPSFTRYVEEILAQLPTTSNLADPTKMTLLRNSALNVVNDIFSAPTPENIKRGVKAVSGFVYVLMKDPKAYGMLLGLSNHDHYTLQHSVGVATNAIILAHKIGINDEKTLIELGTGGLLHDIGKTKVSPAIINKKGPLDEGEWAEMKQHAQWGYEMIQHNPDVGMRAKLAIWQHHEEPSGKGYPMGLTLDQIDLFAKIVTISDIYNALTTDRSYSDAKPPFEAFKVIKSKLSHKIDQALFESMVLIYGGVGLS